MFRFQPLACEGFVRNRGRGDRESAHDYGLDSQRLFPIAFTDAFAHGFRDFSKDLKPYQTLKPITQRIHEGGTHEMTLIRHEPNLKAASSHLFLW